MGPPRGNKGKQQATGSSTQSDQNSNQAALIDPQNQQSATDDNLLAVHSKLDKILEEVQSTKSEIQTLKSEMKDVKSEIAEIKSSLESTTSTADEALCKMKQVETQLQTVVTNDVLYLRNELSKVKSDNKQLHDHINRLEAQSRRDNLILYGIQENVNENCLAIVYQVLHDNLGIENPQNIKVVRCHRLGPKSRSQPRPIIFKLHYFPDREMIWSQKKMLKGTKLWLSEDFPIEINQRRQLLDPIRKKAVSEGKLATLSVDRLIIDGRAYTVDMLDSLPTSLTPAEVFTKRSGEYTCFFSKHSPLSNFYGCQFKEDGLVFSSNEQYYQYQKALHCNDITIAQTIMKTDDPAQCKKLGNKVSITDQKVWEDESLQIMYKGCLAKFLQNNELKEFLLSTDDTIILEANPRDFFWSIGLKLSDPDLCKPESWKGKNFLGKTLRKVRDHISSSSD